MTNLKTTKRALLSSVVALLVCFTMLLGTTFAWFTDSVTSNGNIIQTGTLEIGMYWMEGDEDPETAKWEDASEGAIFNNTKWEPGYVEAKHIKIANEGTLALKYKLLIVPNGEVEALADVIDVYYVEGATPVTRDTLPTTAVLVGTLRDMIDDPDGAIHGALLPAGETATDTYERVGEVTATIAFKMQESAGNEYKGMSIGTDFAIQLLATQYTFEEDSFDNQYDKDALYPVVTGEELISAISEGKSVTLANDISFDEKESVIINAGVESTIDLAGNTLSFGTLGGIVMNEGATVNLTDSSGNESDLSASIYPSENVTINIDGVNLYASGSSLVKGSLATDQRTVINMYSGRLTINNSTTNTTCAAVSGSNMDFNMYGGEINVVSTATTTPGVCAAAISVEACCNVNLIKGKIVVDGADACVVYDTYEKTTKKDGTDLTDTITISKNFEIELKNGATMYETINGNDATTIFEIIDNREEN